MSTEALLSLVALGFAMFSPIASTALAYFSFRALTEWRLTQVEAASKDHSITLARIDKRTALIAKQMHIEDDEP